MLTEFEIKRYINSKSNGGGNPYHDAKGKFAEGPDGAFNYSDFSSIAGKKAIKRDSVEGFKNKEAAEKIDFLSQGMFEAARIISDSTKFVETAVGKIRSFDKEKIKSEFSKKSGNFSSLVAKSADSLDANYDIERIGRALGDAYLTIDKIASERSKILKTQDAKKRETKLKQSNKKIDMSMKKQKAENRYRLSLTRDKNSKAAIQEINDSVLGALQTLKYLD